MEDLEKLDRRLADADRLWNVKVQNGLTGNERDDTEAEDVRREGIKAKAAVEEARALMKQSPKKRYGARKLCRLLFGMADTDNMDAAISTASNTIESYENLIEVCQSLLPRCLQTQN